MLKEKKFLMNVIIKEIGAQMIFKGKYIKVIYKKRVEN